MRIVLVAVVDTESDQFGFSRFHEFGQLMVVRDTDIIDLAYFLLAYIDGAEPVRALEIQEDAFVLPFFRDGDFALVPGRPHVFVQACQAVEVAVRRFVTDLVVIGNAGKGDGFLQAMHIADIERAASEIHKIRLESPFPGKVDFLRLSFGGDAGE